MKRRIRLDLNTKAEIAILEAMHELEKIGADPVLTEAGLHLAAASNLLSNYIDSEIKKCTLTETP